jgi:hypothetical protein
MFVALWMTINALNLCGYMILQDIFKNFRKIILMEKVMRPIKKGPFLFYFILPLLLAGCKPSVTITAPTNGATFEVGETITFEGKATDPQHPDLDGYAYVWTSDKDGKIGTGASFTTADLSEGEHTITLTVTDPDGQAGQSSVKITIGNDGTSTTTTTIEGGFTTTTIGTDPTTTTSTLPPTNHTVWAKSYDADSFTGFNMFYANTDPHFQQTTDGGYIVFGDASSGGSVCSDAFMMKIDKNGNIEWQKKYGTNGVENQWFSFAQQTTDGGYIVAGNRDTHCWVLKLTNLGEVSWQKDFGTYEYPGSIQQTTDGGYILGGLIKLKLNQYIKYALLKLDSNGNVLWQKYYFKDEDTVSAFSPSNTQQTKDGGYIVAGNHQSGDVGRMLKFDINGNIVWNKIYSDSFNNIQQTNDGGYVTNDAIFIAKLDNNGNIVWKKRYNYILINSLQQTSDAGYIVGSSFLNYPAFMKLNARGDIEWVRIFKAHTTVHQNGYPMEGTHPMEIRQTMDGGYMAAYFYFDNTTLNKNLNNLLKLDSYGNIIGCDYFETVNEVTVSNWNVGTVQGDTIYTENSEIISIDTKAISQDVSSLKAEVICEGNSN